MKEIRLGTIGTGVIVHSILDGVRRTEGIRCVAVYSRSEEKARQLANKYGVAKTYNNLEEMLLDDEINFVYVASPNSLHYEQTKRALEFGKNVICEKPFCAEREQVEELTELAKKKELFLIDATPTTYLPNFEILKNKVKKIGRLRLVLCNYSQYSSRYDQVLEGKFPNVFNSKFAGGCLQDINYYNVYFNVALFGKPEQMYYYANMCGGGVDTSGILLMKYQGFVSECAGAKDTWGINSAQIQGEKGFIYVENGTNGIEKVKVVTKTSDEEIDEQTDPDRWYYEVQKMTKLVLADNKEWFYNRLSLTADVIEVLQKARKSAGIIL